MNNLKPEVSNVLKKDSYRSALGEPIPEKEDFNTGHSVIVIRDNPIYNVSGVAENDGKELRDLFGEGWIKGVSLEPLELNLETNWVPIDSSNCPIAKTISSFLGGLSGYATLLGREELGSHYSSRHVWKKPGYLKINPKFRVVDYYGNSDPVKSVQFLHKYIVGVKDTNEVMSKLKRMLEGSSAKAREVIQTFLGGQTKAIGEMDDGSLKDVRSGFVVAGTDVMNTILGDTEKIIGNVSPPPVSIQIGTWFYLNDMVIENIDFDFSRELGRHGTPLWVDINISMRSRFILRNWKDVGVGQEFKRIPSETYSLEKLQGQSRPLFGTDNSESGKFADILKESYENPNIGNAMRNAFIQMHIEDPDTAYTIIDWTKEGRTDGLKLIAKYAVQNGASVDDFTALRWTQLGS